MKKLQETCTETASDYNNNKGCCHYESFSKQME